MWVMKLWPDRANVSRRPASDETNEERNSDCVRSVSLALIPGDWSQWQNIDSYKETKEQSLVKALVSHQKQDSQRTLAQ